jgi:hypothetical protein
MDYASHKRKKEHSNSSKFFLYFKGHSLQVYHWQPKVFQAFQWVKLVHAYLVSKTFQALWIKLRLFILKFEDNSSISNILHYCWSFYSFITQLIPNILYFILSLSPIFASSQSEYCLTHCKVSVTISAQLTNSILIFISIPFYFSTVRTLIF